MPQCSPLTSGTPCNATGVDLPVGSQPPPFSALPDDDYTPYDSRNEFELADWIFRRNQTPGTQIDDLMDIWGAREGDPPFSNHDDLYSIIDSTALGDIP